MNISEIISIIHDVFSMVCMFATTVYTLSKDTSAPSASLRKKARETIDLTIDKTR